MPAVIGFESQVDAYAAASALARLAHENGFRIAGAALTRCDTDRGIHIEPVPGYEMPSHLMVALGAAIDAEGSGHILRPGENALVVAFSVGDAAGAELVARAALEEHGALWVRPANLGPSRAARSIKKGAAAAPGT